MNNKFIKSLFVAVLAFALLISGFNVFAAGNEKDSDGKNVTITASVVEADEKVYLSVDIKNDNPGKMLVTNVLEINGNELKLKGFAEEPYLVGINKNIEPRASMNYMFEIEGTVKENKSKKVDLTLSYELSDTDSVKFPAETKEYSISAKDVLAEEKIEPEAAIKNFLGQTGFKNVFGDVFKGAGSFAEFTANYGYLVMIIISFVLMYLAIGRGFEPLLLLPISFGMLLTNLPGADMFHEAIFAGGHVNWGELTATGGLLDFLYLGVKLGIYPCLIFMGVGAMTDFGPLIANPKSLLLGAAAQLGIFATYIVAVNFLGFNSLEAGSIGIIGGADGPTAIFVTSKLAPHLLGPIAVAAYSYMALVPVIQPPIMKVLTTKKERQIVMKPLREVSKKEKIIFPIAVTVFVALLVPSAAPLVGCLMLGNLFKECGVADRLSKTAQNELMNIVTIFLGVTVGATATAKTFLSISTLKIIIIGVVAFGIGTAGGVLLAKIMNIFLKKNKINPLIGSAGVSAVPMAARVSQVVGQKENPRNFLLMHAMGPNVAGVIGSAIAAGVLLALFA